MLNIGALRVVARNLVWSGRGGPSFRQRCAKVPGPPPVRCTGQRAIPHWSAVAPSALPQVHQLPSTNPSSKSPSFLLHLVPLPQPVVDRRKDRITRQLPIHFIIVLSHYPLNFPPSKIPIFFRVVSAECPDFWPGLTSLSFSPSFSPNRLVPLPLPPLPSPCSSPHHHTLTPLPATTCYLRRWSRTQCSSHLDLTPKPPSRAF